MNVDFCLCESIPLFAFREVFDLVLHLLVVFVLFLSSGCCVVCVFFFLGRER